VKPSTLLKKEQSETKNEKYCGVAPKVQSIDRPLLVNGYASSISFIGNNCKYTQQTTIDRYLGNIPTNRITGHAASWCQNNLQTSNTPVT
jgi:hypothetical protein